MKHELRKVPDLETIWMLETRVQQKSSKSVLNSISGAECYVGENSPLTLSLARIRSPQFACVLAHDSHHGTSQQ